ncbi:MAG: carbonic anhydrase [Flavobacteriaceae bacterium]|jgi:carbonic anhydrase
MNTHTKISQDNTSPTEAIAELVNGNRRFTENAGIKRDLKDQVIRTSSGQYPIAVIHSCIDSRVPVELVFDLGIGDVFSSRVAGNIINEDVLGSMEYGCKVAGSKVIVVLGHTKCGAVTAACNHVELGNITALLSKIESSVNKVESSSGNLNGAEIEQVTLLNIENSIEQIRDESSILKEMEDAGQIKIVGAVYSVESGKVEFL